MFGNMAIRLLRENWKNATLLAEELYAMMKGTIPLEHNAPVKLNGNDNPDAPLKITRPSQTANPAIDFDFGGDEPIRLQPNDENGITLVSPQITFHYTDFDGRPKETKWPGPDEEGTSVFPARVESHSSGSQYRVRIYPSGVSGPFLLVTATQLSIATGSVIPDGTWTTVGFTGSGRNKSYFMQVPVWL